MNDAVYIIWGSNGKVITLEVDSVQIVKWWVNVSYAVHPSHAGAAMFLGKGSYIALRLDRN